MHIHQSRYICEYIYAIPTLALSKSGYGSKHFSLLSACFCKLPVYEFTNIVRYLSQKIKHNLLFNSLRDRRPGREPIPYICDFSRGGLNARFMRSHLNLAPRPQI